MTLSQLANNIKSIKVKKVPRQKIWQVIDTRYYGDKKCIAEFDNKNDAEKFVDKRIFR